MEEMLFMYLAIYLKIISWVSIREDKDGVQKLVYYISRVLHDAETGYSKMEKIVYTLIISVQWLRPYFEAHYIVLLTNQLLKALL